MATLARMHVEIAADVRGLVGGLETAQQKVGQVGRSMTSMGKTLTTRVSAPLAAVGVAAFKMAADAEESANKFNVVMGGAADSVRQRLMELTETIPLTQAEMEGMAGGIQDMLVPMGVARDQAAGMSADMVELAGDLASFNNVPTTQVLEAMQSALAGASEPMRRFGVDTRKTRLTQLALEEGLIQQGQELDNTTTALATLAAVQRDSTDAIGDAARTTDSATNSVRFLWRDIKELAITIGEVLIPVVLPWIQKLREVVKRVRTLSPEKQKLIVIVGALAAALGPVLVALGAVATALGALSAPIAAVVAAVGGMATAWVLFGEEIRAVWLAVQPVFSAIGTVVTSLSKVFLTAVDIIVGTAFVQWKKGIKNTWRAWKVASKAIVGIVSGVATAVREFLVEHFEPVVEMAIEFIEMIEGAWSWLKEKVTGETVPRMSRELGGLFERMKRDTTSTTSDATTDIAADFEGLNTDVVNTTANMATGVASEIDNMESLVVPKMARVGKAVFDAYDDQMTEIVSSTDQMTGDVVDLLGDMEIEAPEIVGNMGTDMHEEYKGATGDIIDETANMLTGIVDEFEGLESGIMTAVESIPGPLGDALGDIAAKLNIGGTIDNVSQNIQNWIDTALAIVDALQTIWDFITDKGEDFLGFLGHLGSTGGKAEFGIDPTGGGGGFGGLGPQGPLPPPSLPPTGSGTGAQAVHLQGVMVSQLQLIQNAIADWVVNLVPEQMQQFRSMAGFLSTIVERMNVAVEQLTTQTDHLATMAGAGTTGTTTSGQMMGGGGMVAAGAGGGGGGTSVVVHFHGPVTGVTEESLARRITQDIDAVDSELGRRRRTQRSASGTLRTGA